MMTGGVNPTTTGENKSKKGDAAGNDSKDGSNKKKDKLMTEGSATAMALLGGSPQEKQMQNMMEMMMGGKAKGEEAEAQMQIWAAAADAQQTQYMQQYQFYQQLRAQEVQKKAKTSTVVV